jgi:WbqC-like protein family
MTDCVLGSQYIPSIEYFAHWKYHGKIRIEAHEHFQKRTWRNKTAIQGPDLPLLLTVPLCKGKHQQMLIREVLISYDEPWHKIHLNSLKTAYGKTAFFDEITSELERIYDSNPRTLWELNQNFIDSITSMMPGEWNMELTESFHPVYADDILDLRKGIPGGASAFQMDDSLAYPQVQRLHKVHQPNLCILDALCHLGPDTISYLARYAAKLYDKPS